MNHLDKTNEKIPNSCNNKVVTLQNKCYNDMSKSLTEKKLREVLNSLEECPSKEYLMNIWSHTVGVAKEGLDNILKELKELIQKYLDNDIYVGVHEDDDKIYLYERMWNEYISRFYETIINEEK
ncbi:hypothetical protein C923_00978 [Plasmodium falciparum UGT5.1]|uniref:Plasmodium RESA N-terminal domain-containing protein n=1 Tax=Plasmodium falciparum UGT5.1 TaxID=1237627 RepID=W7JTZ4_PLAFA|nr:hypothetical protein C923_00978 [Plasmodium falciparum UGT5.1]